MSAQLALQARPNGQQYPLAVWKEHFRAEYLGYKTVTTKNPLTGKKVRTRQRVSTEDLGVMFPATFQQWEGMQVDPDTGEIIGGLQCQ